MTTITQITDRPLLVVLMEDEPVHTFENGYRCSDPTCLCAASSAQIVESTLASEPSWLHEQYRPLSSGSYYEPGADAPVWQLTGEEEMQDLVDDDGYPSEEEIDAMYQDRRRWESDYL